MMLKFFMKKIKRIFNGVTYELTQHNTSKLKSFDDFVHFLYMPVDGASICVGRMLFGKNIENEITDKY